VDINSYEEGVPSWVSLTTANAAASTRFYGSLVRLGLSGGFGDPGTSWTALLRGRPAAAITPVEGAERAKWSMHIRTSPTPTRRPRRSSLREAAY